MPQLDKFSFMPQIFWLIIIFFALYFILLHYVLPQLFVILKIRSKLIFILKNDLLSFGNKEVDLQQKYINNINYFISQSNYCFSHLKITLDTQFNFIQNYIKNMINFHE